MKKKQNKKRKAIKGKKISREKAIQKIGITALTAASITFLSAKDAPADSVNRAAKAPRRGR